MQGKIISYSSHKKRVENSITSGPEQKIKSLETEYAASPQEHILSELRKLKLKLNEITN